MEEDETDDEVMVVKTLLRSKNLFTFYTYFLFLDISLNSLPVRTNLFAEYFSILYDKLSLNKEKRIKNFEAKNIREIMMKNLIF